MIRCTRLIRSLNSLDSHRFLAAVTTKSPLQFSPPRKWMFTSLPNRTTGLEPPSTEPTLQSKEPDPISCEEFIHIENPTPIRAHLSHSIVNVEEQLRIDAAGSVTVSDDAGGDADATGPSVREKVVLSEEMSKDVVFLTCESAAEGGVCDVYLVGTAHVSKESCRQVEAIVSHLKPEVVFLELCSRRLQGLKEPTMRKKITMWEFITKLKKMQNPFHVLITLMYIKVASKLDVVPRSEFRVAFDEAMKYGGKVILGDRPVQITLERTWAKMPLPVKIAVTCSIILLLAVTFPSSEKLSKMVKESNDIDIDIEIRRRVKEFSTRWVKEWDDIEVTRRVKEMSKKYFSPLVETLVHERDQYMSSTLLKVASEHSSVVAVVGKGHLRGIKRYWKQPIQIEDLMEYVTVLPPTNRVGNAREDSL